MIDLDVGPDSGCDWQWGPSSSVWKDLIGTLAELSEKTWSDIESERTGGHNRHRKNHSMEVASLPKPAQNRISVHFGDEAPDTLFRFRLSGRKRLWGVRDGAIFHLLWYDEEHRVYPVDK